jgi:hypothetical protein
MTDDYTLWYVGENTDQFDVVDSYTSISTTDRVGCVNIDDGQVYLYATKHMAPVQQPETSGTPLEGFIPMTPAIDSLSYGIDTGDPYNPIVVSLVDGQANKVTMHNPVTGHQDERMMSSQHVNDISQMIDDGLYLYTDSEHEWVLRRDGVNYLLGGYGAITGAGTCDYVDSNTMTAAEISAGQNNSIFYDAATGWFYAYSEQVLAG